MTNNNIVTDNVCLYRNLYNDSFLEGLQRIMVSAKARDPCGMVLWCLFGSLMSTNTDWWTEARKHLIYLTLADLVDVGGDTMASLIKLQSDRICSNVTFDKLFWRCM